MEPSGRQNRRKLNWLDSEGKGRESKYLQQKFMSIFQFRLIVFYDYPSCFGVFRPIVLQCLGVLTWPFPFTGLYTLSLLASVEPSKGLVITNHLYWSTCGLNFASWIFHWGVHVKREGMGEGRESDIPQNICLWVNWIRLSPSRYMKYQRCFFM